MNYDILLSEAKENYVTARILAWPDEPTIKAATREDALAQARATIMERLAGGEVSTIEIKPEEIEHPWQRFYGTWADDPTFDDFVAEIERYRREIDAQYDADYQAQYSEAKAA